MGSEHYTLHFRGALLIAAAAVAGCWHLDASGVDEAPDADVYATLVETGDDADTGSGSDPIPTFDVGYLTDVGGSGPDDVWVVTGKGEALHFDGEEWAVEKVADVKFTGVWAGAPDLVYAINEGPLWDPDPADEKVRIHHWWLEDT